MEESEKVFVEDAAWVSWQLLPPAVRAEIIGALEPLAGTPPESWPPRVRAWWPAENVYALSTWLRGHELFVFIVPKDGRIHIDGMAMRELIEKLRGQMVGATA